MASAIFEKLQKVCSRDSDTDITESRNQYSKVGNSYYVEEEKN